MTYTYIILEKKRAFSRLDLATAYLYTLFTPNDLHMAKEVNGELVSASVRDEPGTISQWTYTGDGEIMTIHRLELDAEPARKPRLKMYKMLANGLRYQSLEGHVLQRSGWHDASHHDAEPFEPNMWSFTGVIGFVTFTHRDKEKVVTTMNLELLDYSPRADEV